jgi:hypothetical protein
MKIIYNDVNLLIQDIVLTIVLFFLINYEY